MPKFKAVFNSQKISHGDLGEHVFEATEEQIKTVPYDTASKAVAKEYGVHFNDIKIHKIVGA